MQLYAITLVGVCILYFGIAGLSYLFICESLFTISPKTQSPPRSSSPESSSEFHANINDMYTVDKRMMRHPRFLKNQVRMEITMSVKGFPVLDLMTLPWFLGECRGYSRMYEGIENSPLGKGRLLGIGYIIASSALFLWFTDFLIYIVHRVLHWPAVYKRLHKPHHKWVIPTPFSSHAFHPLDGYLQSIPYHLFVFLVPLHKYTYLGLFVVVNLWSIFVCSLYILIIYWS